MKPSELQQWLLSDAIREDLELVTRATVATELIGLPLGPDVLTKLEHLDWERLLLAGSLLARSTERAPIEAALRIATAAVCLPSAPRIHDAGAILLQKLSNYRAADLACQRHLLAPGLTERLGASARLEALTRELNNSILIEHSGEWLQVNPFQQDFWNRARNPESWISVSAPTASGKTFLVLQWLIDEMKATAASVAVYLAPTRALVSEIESHLASLLKRMSIVDIDITSLPLSAKYQDALKLEKKLIYILTQERLHLLANAFNDEVQIDLLVADEAHKVGDRLRGVVLQDAIERASRSNSKIKIVFISPATQNPEALLDDAPGTTKREAVDSDIPTVLQNVILATQPSRKPTEWLFKLRQSKDTYLPIGSVTLQARPTSLRKKLALIATSIGSKGGTLVYANGPAEAEEIALLLTQLVDGPQNENDSELVALADLARRGVHESYQLAPFVKKGVAFHYGNMPSLLREEIERLFRRGKIRFLVCTSTLVEGVNLSCRTIVVRGPRKGVGKPMEPHDFWNLAGRAGRWGDEFQGNIVCVDPDDLIAWPSGVPERRRYPIERETDSVFRSNQELMDFINSRWDRSTNELNEFAQFEQVCAYLLALFLRDGSILNAPFTKRHEADFISAVNTGLGNLVSRITLPASLVSRHSGVSPVGMQKLLNYFRSYKGNIEDLLPAPPESGEAYNRLIRIMETVNEQLYPAFLPKTLIPLHTLIVLEWLKGYSLAAIIKARIAYNRKHKRAVALPKLIRNTWN